MAFPNFEESWTDDFGHWTIHAELNNTGQMGSSPGKETGKIEVLGNDDFPMHTRMVKNHIIRVSRFSDITPVSRADPKGRKMITPTRREGLVDDEVHDASS